jgi:hypothetical protein
MLAQRLPNHTFLGVDLAEGMIEVARKRVATAAGVWYVLIFSLLTHFSSHSECCT